MPYTESPPISLSYNLQILKKKKKNCAFLRPLSYELSAAGVEVSSSCFFEDSHFGNKMFPKSFKKSILWPLWRLFVARKPWLIKISLSHLS